MLTTITRQCPIPGLEGVAVTYNLMTTEAELDAFQKSIGTAPGRIVESVQGWPGGEFGPEPLGKDAPMHFRVWAMKQVTKAIAEYMADPNS